MFLSWTRSMRPGARTCTLGALIAGSLAVLAVMSFGAAVASAAEEPCALPGSEFQGADGNQNTPGIEQVTCEALKRPTTRDWQSDVSAKKVVTSEDPQASDNELTGKENVPNKWTLGAHVAGVTPPKDNIITAWSEVDQQAAATFLYLAFQREGATGTTFLTFELNQVKGEWENEAKSMIPCRTTGDVLISYEVSGSSIGEVVVQEWKSTKSKSVTIEGKTVECGTEGELKGGAVKVEPSAGVQGAMNTATIENFLPDNVNGTPTTIGKNLFGEAALNLVEVLKEAKINPCFDFGQIWMHTRSSLATTSELHDYVSPVPLLVQSCSISGRKFDDANGNKKHDAGEAYLEGWKIQLLNATTKAVVQETTTGSEGSYTFTNVGPGTYIVQEVGQSGWTCDVPGEGTACQYEVTIDSEHLNVTEREFGNVPTSKVVTTQEPKSGTVGSKFGDSATVSGPATGGGPTPTGEVEFTLYSEEGCKGAVAGPIKVALSGGKASIPTASKVTLSSAGTYYWVATYGGDTNNAKASSGCKDEPVIVNPPIEVTKTADAATTSAGEAIGFTVTIKNPGATTATGVTLADKLPGGKGPVHWEIDSGTGNPTSFEIEGADGSQSLILKGQPISLAAGASLTVHVTATTGAANCGATYDNTAKVTTTNDGSDEASASESVKCAEIEVTKTADAATVSAGEAIGFTVTVKNNGAGEAKGVKLEDPLPAGNVGHPVTWSISPANSSFEVTGAAGGQSLVLKGQPVSLAAGASLSVHVTAATSSTSCTAYENTAKVTTSNDGKGEASASESVKCAEIEVKKTADAATVSAGEAIGFTVTIKNNGAGTAKGVELEDPLPAGNVAHPVTWSISPANSSFEVTGAAGGQSLVLKGQPVSLAAGASLSVHVTAATSSTSCATYENTAKITTSNDGKGEASASESVKCAEIEVKKTADAATVSAGEAIGFTVTIKNNGAGEAKGVTLTDKLPGGNGPVHWEINGGSDAASFEVEGADGSQLLILKGQPVNLAAGGSLTVHVTAATGSANCGATYDNTAKVTTSNDGKSEASASESVKCAEIEVKKTADATSVSAGEAIGFTVTIKNNGAGEAKGATLTDKLPGGNGPVHWEIDGTTGNPASFEVEGLDGSQSLKLKGQPISLAAGASLTVHITAATGAANCGATYENTAEVTTANGGSPSASASEEVLCAEIEVTKTADAASISAGEAIGFTVTIKNNGAGEAKGVTLTDKLPGGNGPVHWEIDGGSGAASFEVEGTDGSQLLILKGQPVSLAAGASLTVHVTAATGSANCGATYDNTAKVTTSNDGKGEASASESVKCAEIEVQKTADAATVSAGEAIGFTVTIKNNGTGEAKGVTLTDKLPGGNGPVHWEINGGSDAASFEVEGADGSQSLILKGQPVSLAAGASLTVHVTAATGSANCGATYDNTAKVTTSNDGKGEASASESVKCAEIEVQKTADAASVSAGEAIGFTVTIKNNGTGEAKGVTLSDALPAGNSGHPVTWSISPANSSFEITGAAGSQSLILKGQPVSLAAGASLTVHVTAATAAVNCGATYSNTAKVTTGNDGSGEASAKEEVLCAEIEVKKTADAAHVSAGEAIGFTVTVKNNGEGTAKGVTLTDALPGGNGPVSWTIDGTTGNPTAFEITGAAGSQSLVLKGQPVSIAASASLTVHVTAATSGANCGVTYDNTAKVTTTNDGSGEAGASELVLCTPKISTKATPSVTLGAKIKDTATLSGLANADGTGKVTFKLYSDGECKTTPLFESTVPGSGGISQNGDVASGEYAPSATGTYYWVAAYSGDKNNEPAVSGCKDAEEASVVGVHPGMTVVKEQQVAGSGQPFTTAPLSVTVGQQINYRITVTNTGDVPLTLSFSDPHCDAGTITGPTGNLNLDGTLPPAGVAQYFCSHVVQAGDVPQFTNAATVTGQPPSGPPVSGESSVVANVAAQVVKPACTVSESSIVLRGVGGSKRRPFTVRISSLGIEQITFYLDKRKLKTLTQAQARKGQFTIKIDPRKLSYGGHTVSIRTVMTEAACAKLARSGVFVHPRPPIVKPKFTG